MFRPGSVSWTVRVLTFAKVLPKLGGTSQGLTVNIPLCNEVKGRGLNQVIQVLFSVVPSESGHSQHSQTDHVEQAESVTQSWAGGGKMLGS